MGEAIYAYEVDGMENSLAEFDDANVPSLLSIPLRLWTAFKRAIYENTRDRHFTQQKSLLQYFSSKILNCTGSPHTLKQMVCTIALA
jgi:meiotically up-regulated gene 157 (Mug157) protein